jgi:hypothetical protein
MEFLPCTSCHRQALTYFSPDKYFLEEESASSDYLYRLPFEFNDDDKLGPWDILLSEDTIKDLRHLESSPEIIREVMKKLGQLSLGEWDEHELRRTVQTHAIPVYEIELPKNDGLKILWQVDYGFSIRSDSLTQLVKVWAVTANKEQIHKILENLSIVHRVYTSKHLCTVEQTGRDNIILPITFGNEEEVGSPENELHNTLMDDEKSLEVHKMLVTNKFVPLSRVNYKDNIINIYIQIKIRIYYNNILVCRTCTSHLSWVALILLFRYPRKNTKSLTVLHHRLLLVDQVSDQSNSIIATGNKLIFYTFLMSRDWKDYMYCF